MKNTDLHIKPDLGKPLNLPSRDLVALENQQLREELRKADHHKNEFLAMLAHELRNPLAPIRSGLDVLAIDQQFDAETVDLMKQHVSHLTRLVDDLLDASRTLRGQVRLRCSSIDLRDVCHRAEEAVLPTFASRQQNLSISLPEEPLPLSADAVRLTQLFSNLLANASKYSADSARVWFTALRVGERVEVTIRDEGVGMDAAWLPEIFDLFSQVPTSIDRAQGGLGLGLTLTKAFVEMHGGTITAASEGLGKGSTFTVSLPLAVSMFLERSESMVPALPDSRRVLVVDDGIGAAKMLQLLVSRLGPHEVEVAHDGPAALEAAQRFSPDLVLLDIGLPRMDGYEVARRLRECESLGGTTLVAVTGYGQDEDRRRSYEAGFNEHVVKPIDLETLKKLLNCPKKAVAPTAS